MVVQVFYKLPSLEKLGYLFFFFFHDNLPHPTHAMTSAEDMWKQNLVQFSVLVSWVVYLAVELCSNRENNHIMSVSLKWLSVLSSGSFPRVARNCLSAGTRHVTLVICLLWYLQAVMCHTDTHFYLNTHSTAAPWCDSVFLIHRYPRRWMPV